jgi:FkbM family methyltransferase
MENVIAKFVNTLSGLFSINHKKDLIQCLKKTEYKIKTVVDIGGHQGEYTDLFLKKIGTLKKIFVFEPIPYFYNFLIKKYKNKKKIKILKYAVGEKKIKKIFYQNHHARSSSLKQINKKSIYYKIKSFLLKKILNKKIIVQQISMDVFFQNKLQIDLLKIDVEGNEYEVLNGCKSLFKKNLVNFIYIEILNHSYYQNYSKKKIETLLKKYKFKILKQHKTPFLFSEDRLYIKQDLIK